MPGALFECSGERVGVAGVAGCGAAGELEREASVCGAWAAGVVLVDSGAFTTGFSTETCTFLLRAGRLVAATPISSGEALLRRTGIAGPPAATEMPGSGASRGGLPGLTARPIAKKHTKTTAHRQLTMTSPPPSMPVAGLSAWIQRLALRTVLMTTGKPSA
ncbi:MAG: hypothetical protein ACHQCH_04450 [Solirubrobacterales bacterium]